MMAIMSLKLDQASSLVQLKQSKLEDDNEMSCCSEDSELSVGQEECEEVARKKQRTADKILNQASETFNNLKNEHDLDDELSNQSSSYASSSMMCSPKEKMNGDNVIRSIPMRPSPNRFHEEFLRSSQLYAEELMRQQMSLVAAARGIQLNGKLEPPKHSAAMIAPLAFLPQPRMENLSPSSVDSSPKVGFRPHIPENGNPALRTPGEHLNFRNLHNHLNAISQITNNLSSDIRKITSPSLSSMTSRESSQSPPNYHQLQQQHFFAQQNQLNEPNLKFSVDNILKPDFGRRITEPLLKSAKAKRALLREQKHNNNNNLECLKNMKRTDPMDLTSVQDKINPSSPPPSTTPTPSGTASESGSSEKQPIVWPAWVYCTRYSDRPSSGKIEFYCICGLIFKNKFCGLAL